MASNAATPSSFDTRHLWRGAAEVGVLFAVLAAIIVLAPGLGEVRDGFERASTGWLAVAVALEFLSGMAYVALFRPVFCRAMRWRTSLQIAWAELAAGSIVPASGASGVALGAWVLHRRGMENERIARRSVAFLLIKSSVNFVAVAVVGIVAALGVGPHLSLWLTVLPAVMAVAAIALVVLVPRIGPGADVPDDAPRLRRWTSTARRTLITGVSEAGVILRERDLFVIGGAIGYWIFDNAVLWATYEAIGSHVPVVVLLLGYLIGQLGGLLPIPGGIGGIDGGLIGTLIVYGAPAAATVTAVLLYRVILFWLPLVVGVPALLTLRRSMAGDPEAHPTPAH